MAKTDDKKRREEMVKAVLSGLGMSCSEFLLIHTSDIKRLAGRAITLADEAIKQLDEKEEE